MLMQRRIREGDDKYQSAKYYINVSANEKKKAVELLSGIIRKEG